MAKPTNDLGRDRVGTLLVRLALPAIAAQLINALYNIVDRMYIGHIEGVGDVALTGLGVCFPVLMFISALSALVGMGGGSRAAIRMGEGREDLANEILGSCAALLAVISAARHRGVPAAQGAHAPPLRRQRQHHRLRRGLPGRLSVGHPVRAGLPGAEQLYHHPGLFHLLHGHGGHRRRHQHRAGSHFHFRVRHGGEGRGPGHHSGPRAFPPCGSFPFCGAGAPGSGSRHAACACAGASWPRWWPSGFLLLSCSPRRVWSTSPSIPP